MKLIYCTSNKYKLETAKKILEPLGVEIEGKKLNIPEIQANEIEEVAKYSSKTASELLGFSTLKNDSGLIIPVLNGFPGPYTKFVEETIKEDGIINLLKNCKDRTAYFIEVLAFTEYGKEPKVFISKTEGSIAFEQSGDFGWSYDRIFIPKGQTKTLACFNDDERWKFWNDDAYINLFNFLKETSNE